MGALLEEMYIDETEADLSDSAVDELGETFGQRRGDLPGPSAGARQSNIVGDDLPDPGIVVEEDAAVLDFVIDGFVGLGSEVGLAMPSAASSFGSVGPVPPIEEEAGDAEAEAPAAWEALIGPSRLGYCYLGGRPLMRVQYGKPKNSCTINCHMHSTCHLLISMSRVPELNALKCRFSEVGDNQTGASIEQRKALAKANMGSGKAKCSAKAMAKAAA